MTVTIEISDNIAQQARYRGMEPAEYVQWVLARGSAPAPLPPPKLLSPEELADVLDRLAQFSDKIPDLPLEAFSRESLYGDSE